jgi:glycosyltransferase involved in cell wall biosynthesis
VTRPDEVRARHGIADGQVIVGFVGWFKKWHGIEFMIDAFSSTNLALSEAVLLLVGDGPAMESLRELVEHRNMQHRVRFTGPILHEKIPEYLHAIDIAVQPAANEYCCPMKILEYMAVSKPILAPRQENICEILPHGAACFFTPGELESFADNLLSLVRHEPLRRELGLQGHAVLWSRGMLWTKNAEAVVHLITQHLSQKVAAAPSSATRC